MPTINWGKALQRLNELVAIVPQYEGYSGEVSQLRDAFSKARLPRSVSVSRVVADPEEDVKNYELIVRVGNKSSTNLFRITETGSVYYGPFSQDSLVKLSQEMTNLIFAGFGFPVSVEDNVEKGAIALYRCMVKTNGKCEKESKSLQQTIVREDEQYAANYRTNLKESAFSEVRAIWDKVDNFIREADKRDSSDSDSDVLKDIIKRHAAARPLVAPSAVEQAVALRDAARRMLTEFEGSSHLRAFIKEEGECSKVNGSATCSAGEVGGYNTVCRIGDFSTSDYTSCYIPEKPERAGKGI